MFDKIRNYEVPPRPEILPDNFERGITTRVMVDRKNVKNDQGFLKVSPGIAIPNSKVRLLLGHRPTRDTESISNSGVRSNGEVQTDPNDENDTSPDAPKYDTALDKMRESVKRRSRSNSKGSVSGSRRNTLTDEEKRERRVSMRTDKLESGESRRPSPEALKEAIQKSAQQVELIDVDEMSVTERRTSRRKSSMEKSTFFES